MAGSSIPRSKKQVSIIIEQPNMGGISDSPYFGVKNSLGSVVGIDLHSVPGLFTVAQTLKLNSGSTITDLVKILPCSDGNIYFFGKTSGTVWERTSLGVYSTLGTVSPGAGSAGILDAYEFNGFIYYAMQNRLGQWNFANAFSTRNDNFATFANGNASYHPMFYMLSTLYIGDGKNLAQVDKNNTFTGNALVFTISIQITALGKQVNDLFIGASPTSTINESHVYRWNTWSQQTTYDYVVSEPSINCFFGSDADVFVQAGQNCRFYLLNGSQFEMEKQIPSNFPTVYSNTALAQVNYPAVAKFNGIPLFGVSSVSGNPCYEGVYAYGSRGALYPNILTMPYPISSGNLSKIIIWSLATQGNNLFVSWQDNTSGSAVYGVDIIDWNNKYASAFFETRLIKYSRIWLDSFSKVVMNYQSLPVSTAINLFYDANWAGYSQITAPNIITDSIRNEIVAEFDVQAKTIRYKVTFTVSGNNAPTLEDVIILPQ